MISILFEFEPLIDKGINIAVKDLSFRIENCGRAKLKFGKNILILTNVMYSSKLRHNLI